MSRTRTSHPTVSTSFSSPDYFRNRLDEAIWKINQRRGRLEQINRSEFCQTAVLALLETCEMNDFDFTARSVDGISTELDQFRQTGQKPEGVRDVEPPRRPQSMQPTLTKEEINLESGFTPEESDLMENIGVVEARMARYKKEGIPFPPNQQLGYDEMVQRLMEIRAKKGQPAAAAEPKPTPVQADPNVPPLPVPPKQRRTIY